MPWIHSSRITGWLVGMLIVSSIGMLILGYEVGHTSAERRCIKGCECPVEESKTEYVP